MPLVRHTLQGFDSAILERQVRTSDEVLHGTRYEHLPSICKRSHTRPNVDGNAPELIAHDFAFAGVQTGSHIDPERAHIVRNSAGAAHGAGRTVERRQKAIA